MEGGGCVLKGRRLELGLVHFMLINKNWIDSLSKVNKFYFKTPYLNQEARKTKSNDTHLLFIRYVILGF